MKQILILSVFLFPALLFSQEKTGAVDSSGRMIFFFENDLLKDAESNAPLYTVKGNLIFKGASDNRRDIFLLVKMQDLFSASIGEVLNSNMKEIVFTLQDGKFYKGKTESLSDELLLGYFDSDSSGMLKLFDGKTGVELAHLTSRDFAAAQLVALFYVLSEKFRLDKNSPLNLKEVPPSEIQKTETVATYGSIKRLWDTGMDQFEWDGQILKRKWNSFDYEEWTFDGTTLQRAWFMGDDEFMWDGEVLRRKWFSSADEFEWDGRILRRRWGNGRDEFIIQGNIVKRYLEPSGKDEWEIEGDMPIPIIAIVVFNLLRR